MEESTVSAGAGPKKQDEQRTLLKISELQSLREDRQQEKDGVLNEGLSRFMEQRQKYLESRRIKPRDVEYHVEFRDLKKMGNKDAIPKRQISTICEPPITGLLPYRCATRDDSKKQVQKKTPMQIRSERDRPRQDVLTDEVRRRFY